MGEKLMGTTKSQLCNQFKMKQVCLTNLRHLDGPHKMFFLRLCLCLKNINLHFKKIAIAP